MRYQGKSNNQICFILVLLRRLKKEVKFTLVPGRRRIEIRNERKTSANKAPFEQNVKQLRAFNPLRFYHKALF